MSETFYYRSIVKDGVVTRDDEEESRSELAVWLIKPAEIEEELLQTKIGGEVQYKTILEVALGRRQAPAGATPTTANELSQRTELSSYADSRGGRSASTIRGYLSNDTLTRLPSSHPVKRVLRRYIRSQQFGHFSESEPDPDKTTRAVSVEDNERIDKDEIRPNDRPLGEVQASLLLESGSYTQEYRIDLDDRTVTPEDGLTPPGGY